MIYIPPRNHPLGSKYLQVLNNNNIYKVGDFARIYLYNSKNNQGFSLHLFAAGYYIVAPGGRMPRSLALYGARVT